VLFAQVVHAHPFEAEPMSELPHVDVKRRPVVDALGSHTIEQEQLRWQSLLRARRVDVTPIGVAAYLEALRAALDPQLLLQEQMLQTDEHREHARRPWVVRVEVAFAQEHVTPQRDRTTEVASKLQVHLARRRRGEQALAMGLDTRRLLALE